MLKNILSVVAIVALALGLITWARQYSPDRSKVAPVTPVPTAESSAPVPHSSPPPPIPAAASDPVYDFNHKVAQTQHQLTAFVKIARVGDAQIELPFEGLPRARPAQGLDDGKSGGFFAPLSQAIESGDEAAVRMLYTALQFCERARAPTTPAELQAMEVEARAAIAKTGGRIAGEVLQLDQALANVRAAYERCQGVEPAMYDQALEYLRESTERGEPDNSLLYARAIATDKPEEARAIQERLWTEQGRVTALDSLAQVSLPHKIASLAIRTALFDGRREEPAAVRIVAEAQEELTAIENSTSPSSFREATEEAARLLGSPRCCKL